MSETLEKRPTGLLRKVSSFLFAGCLLLLVAGAPALDGMRDLVAWSSGQPAGCAFKAKYGVDCPGCGGTRAFRLAARGEFPSAFRENALGGMVGLGTWILVFASLSSGVTNRGPFLLAPLVLVILLMTVTTVVHSILWWRSLPPGLHLE